MSAERHANVLFVGHVESSLIGREQAPRQPDEGAPPAALVFEPAMRDALRGIEEHYLREAGSRRAGYVRGRLDAARHRTDCGAIARDLHSTNTPPVERSDPVRRRSGIDEGPPL
mgnify:CR=1 FL=1